VVYFTKQAFKLKNNQIQPVENAGISARSSSLNVQFAGNAFENLASQKGSPDLIFGLILTAIVLVLAFGSFFAMLLPLGVALFAVGIATAATNVAQSRALHRHLCAHIGFTHRPRRRDRLRPLYCHASSTGFETRLEFRKAIVTAINTSGRAVLFAGSTVCIALLGMLVLQLSFLNGVAIAAALTVLITMFASLTLLRPCSDSRATTS